jgi:His/Glu/Gln/Arg/opine family amino acid ABC transporter permease subunit
MGVLASLQQQFYQSFIDGARWKRYLDGLGTSCVVTVGALALGVILGILVAVVRTSHDQQRGNKNALLGFFNAICEIYTTVIRGTPMMVQLLIMGFVFFASSRHLTLVAILTLGINSGAYVSEIIRGGIMSIDPGQMEAGRSLGMGYGPVMRHVVIPQAIKNILPALGNELITLFKDTSLVTVIGLTDLTKVAIQIQAKTYQALMPFMGIAAMYLVVVMFLTWLLGKFERRLRQSDRR